MIGRARTWLRPADAARGAKLAYTCHGCHGIPNYKNAYPVYSVPKLGGQHAGYLVVALKGYKAQERPHATMHAQATDAFRAGHAGRCVFPVRARN
jgi:cytochrome c553